MSRNRHQASSPAVSLFPFLAVLICTMGVLIVMLVLAVKSSSVKARESKQQHREQIDQQREELLSELQIHEFRVQQIAKARPDVQQRLEDAKLGRSHLDDEIRKLAEQAKSLQQRFTQLQQDQDLALASSTDEASKIEELRTQIQARTEQLDQLRQEVASRPMLYSIVPTKTASGTNRRPIYVECTTEGIFLRPIGIKIKLNDFTKPILPGNPLDAALLATREYWNKFQAASSKGEPYPLIVVRPGGATAYAIARRAMASWDDEFGYELVGIEKQLDWGETDLNLSETVRQSMEIAMLRQRKMVSQQQVQWLNDSRTGAGGTSTFAGEHDGTAKGRGSGMAFTSNGAAGKQRSNPFGIADPSSASSSKTGRKSNSVATFNGGDSSSNGQFDTTKQDSLSRIADGSRRWQANPKRDNPLRGQSNGAADESQSDESSGTAGSDPAAFSMNATAPLASERGQNWALPTKTPGATPYRRPIRVECSGNQYVVFPTDPALRPVRVIVADDDAVDIAIDQLIHHVWKQIEGWGMAEIGGYWKPVLRLHPDESGTQRAEELARKMEGSGIEIERLWR